MPLLVGPSSAGLSCWQRWRFCNEGSTSRGRGDPNRTVTTIRDALGIADGDVADYSLPADWSGCDREQRAKLVADWLANELRFMAG